MVVGAVICGLLFLPDDPDRVWRVTFSSMFTSTLLLNQSINQRKLPQVNCKNGKSVEMSFFPVCDALSPSHISRFAIR